MEWRDEALILSARRHGESAAIAECLTRAHGRHFGLVHGGAGKSKSGQLQPGQLALVTWRARLVESLGTFEIEPVQALGARLMDDPLRLSALMAIASLATAVLPEREPHGAVFDGLKILLPLIASEDMAAWGAVMARWELGLLQELGFGLDLARCAVTGSVDDLAYISPRTGRAVSNSAAEDYAPRLFRMPPFFLGTQGQGTPDPADVAEALRITAHFIETSILMPHGQRLPEARMRLGSEMARQLQLFRRS